MKTKSTKRALVLSALSLLLCVSMLIGSTYAWFTDSVTSAGNIIKSGNLDVTMEWKDATAAGKQQSYKDASEGAIFNYDLWEPGYVEAKNIKIGNAGSLALKYQLNIVANGTVSDLANVIDVYYAEGEYTLADRAMTELTRLGTLNDVLAAISTTASGDLLVGETDTVTLALKMQESAGNEYQNKAIGSDFIVQLLATQLTYEEDSFNNQYDKDAEYAVEVKTADDLAKALKAGGLVKLANDISVTETLTVPAGVAVELDLNGKTINGTKGRDADNNRIHVIVNNGNAVIKNGTVTSAGVNGGSAIYNADGATLTVENVTLNGAPQEGSTWPSYTVNNYGTLTVSDSSIYGVQGIIATNNTANTTVNNVIAYRDGWSSGHVFYTSSTAKVTINGGTYTNDGNGVDGTMIYGGETVVNGGTFIVKEGAYFALCSGSKLTVNGGDFSNIKSCIAWGGAMTISGGTFGFNPTTYVADGYKVTNNGNGTWTVGAYEVSTGAELADAIANGKAVELTQDVSIGKIDLTGAITNDVVIDANGHKITTTDAYGIEVTAGKNVTISNADVEMTKEGDYITYAAGFKIANGDYAGATITLENCTITMANTDWAYAVNMPASVKNLNLVIDNCTLEGAIAVQCWGDNNTVTITNSKLICNYTTNAMYTSYCVALQDDGSNMAENNTFVIDNCEFAYTGIDNFNSSIRAVDDVGSENNTITVTNCTYGEKVVAY